MSAPISVIIPTLDAAKGLGPTLGALTEGLSEGLLKELIITDGGSSDTIAEVADAIGAELVVGAKGRGGQLRRGAAAARGAWLLFLHADTVLAPGWTLTLRRHLDAAAAGRDRAAAFRLAFDEPGLTPGLAAAWANARSRWFALPYGDQGLFISRALYDAVGGYPDIPIMEDVVLARRLGRQRLTLLDSVATTSAERYRKAGWLRQGARNWMRLAAFFAGVAPERIAARYDSGS